VNGFAGIRYLTRLLTLSVLLLLACSPLAFAGQDTAVVAPEQVDSIFDIANEEYKMGKYENAITLYEGLLAGGSGVQATDIHYNLGNAFFRLKHYGKAIAAYRRALRVSPRDQDAIANLQFTREATLDKIDELRGAELWREVLFFHYALSMSETETLFLCAYVATVALATALLFLKSRPLKWLTLVALFLALTFGASFTLRWRATANPSQAVVVTEEAGVHTGPGHNYIVSFSLHDGAELRIHALENEWRQIELADGRRGWIENTYIETI
jgi:tetratricopeptide (TPR) repeat protein